jgi:tRNA 2-thiouridine synthesizing protein A
MTFVKVKLKLAQISPGDSLEVLLTEGEPLKNVPRTVTEQGHTVKEIRPEKPGIHRVIIEKNHPPAV